MPEWKIGRMLIIGGVMLLVLGVGALPARGAAPALPLPQPSPRPRPRGARPRSRPARNYAQGSRPGCRSPGNSLPAPGCGWRLG